MKVSIIGAGALAKLVKNIANNQGITIESFYDDDLANAEIQEKYIQGEIDDAFGEVNHPIVIAIGSIDIRKSLFEKFKSDNFDFATVIHPTAEVADSADIGNGVIIKEGAVIEPDAKIGDNCIIGNNSIICHDTEVGAHVRIGPSVSIAGHANIGESSYLAVNVSVDRTIQVGKGAIIASGCTIWRDVPDNSTVKLPMEMHIDE